MKHEIAHEILCWEFSLGDRDSQGFGLQFWTRSSRLGIEAPEARAAVTEPQFWLWRGELAVLDLSFGTWRRPASSQYRACDDLGFEYKRI